jgi:ABC-2 type transport system ATP-binding protein
MSEAVISIRDLRKAYGEVVAVDSVSLEVHRGEIFGLLGPNGAGKTTTLECLEGLRRPDGGRLRIMEVDPQQAPRRLNRLLGVQLQSSALPATMNVEEALRFFSAYHGVPPNYGLLERFGLAEKRRKAYGELSVGLQRRLALALAIAHRPTVLILDEPTAGLDVASRAELHAIMSELRREGTSMILATHDMSEAEKLSDRIAILLRGRIVVSGTPREITAAGSGFTKVSVRTERSLLLSSGRQFPAVGKQLLSDEYAIFFTADPGATVAELLRYIEEQEDRLIDLRVERPSLEERFLEITTAGGAQ